MLLAVLLVEALLQHPTAMHRIRELLPWLHCSITGSDDMWSVFLPCQMLSADFPPSSTQRF